MNQSLLDGILFSENLNDAIKKIHEITLEDDLLYLMDHYNWDNGFELPEAVLKNENCSLQIALLIFYDAEGASYLDDKNANSNLIQWRTFITKLYEDITANKYAIGNVKFSIPLSKVQLYKLKKSLTAEEMIFVQEI